MGSPAVIYVCPDCGVSADGTFGGYVAWAGCERRGHRQAVAFYVGLDVPVGDVTAESVEAQTLFEARSREVASDGG